MTRDRCPRPRVDVLAELPAKVRRRPSMVRTLDRFERINRAHLAGAGPSPPEGETAWFHHYVCRDTGAQLRFDPARPHTHVSPATGEVHAGEPYDGAWRAMMHAAWLAALERMAVLERAGRGSEANRQVMRDTLLWWADRWPSYRDKPRGGVGKLMPQGLTEAIFQLGVCQILQWVPDVMVGDDWRRLREGMLAPAAEFLRPQWASAEHPQHDWAAPIHNIACWLNAAKYALGWALEDDSLKELAVHGPVGWHEQVRRGVDAEGWWYEKTLTYQTYCLAALLGLVAVAGGDGVDLTGEPKLVRMAEVVLRVVRDDGTTPSWNDGWRGPRIDGLLNPLEFLTGTGRYPDLAAGLHWLARRFPGARGDMSWIKLPGTAAWMDFQPGPRDSVAALVWGRGGLPDPVEPERARVFFPASGIAVITRGAVQLAIRSGPHGGGHDHLDRTDLTVRLRGHPIAEDLGTPGYGGDLVESWYRQPASHRLLIVGRRRQEPSDGRILQADSRRIVAIAHEAWPHTRLEREAVFHPDGRGWTDRTRAHPPAGLPVDWVFHLKGIPLGLECAEPDERDLTGAGLEFIVDRLWIPPRDGAYVQTWTTVAGELTLTLTCRGVEEPQCVLGRCPDNPSDHSLSAIVLSGVSTAEPVEVAASWRLQLPG